MLMKRSSLRSGAGHLVRLVWLGFGLLALGLGIVGVFLPLLPTTPLVLLAAFAFTKGSPRLRGMLVGHRIFGPIIADWEASGAIAPRYKIAACTAMAAILCVSVIMDLSATIIAVQAICLGTAALFVLTRPH
ncbi:hypothetical protein SAMN05444273_11182 [Litoreibacter ascidiaceicola]|uniref:Inner membrane protein n=2 Tax=Litoreibacter ascidiaceicola TaxID=1486859 RepID=A0A1M5EA48_9RHOB|nr:hypothetical protein SAMN05444273_11182 [Litoreibacter ascidiaceicola]